MASGGQYVTHTGLTVMPVSYADSLDWGKSSLTHLDCVSDYSTHLVMTEKPVNSADSTLGLHEEVFRNVSIQI